MRNPFKRETLDDLEFYDDEFDNDFNNDFDNDFNNNFDNKFDNTLNDEYNPDEPQIIESFTEEEFNENESNRKKYKKYKRIINIVFSIILLLLTMVTIDVICVSRYNIGPFFAVKTKTIKDGGSKIYHGLGYKVIKYNQEQGRRDKELGTWALKYNTTPIDTTDIDLALEFENNYQATNKKYYKKFVRLSSTVKEIDKSNNKLILEYLDEDNKYTLDIICSLAPNKSDIDIFNAGDSVGVIGTIEQFKIKSKKENNRVYISNCFAQLEVEAETVEFED